MKKPLVAIGLVLGIIFIVCAVLCGGIVYRGRVRTKQNEADWTASGTTFGQSTDNAGCLAESIKQLREVPEESFSEKARKAVLPNFTSACLKASKRTKDFCLEVPRTRDVGGSFSFIKNQLEKNGVKDKTGAVNVFEEVIKFCNTSAGDPQ